MQSRRHSDSALLLDVAHKRIPFDRPAEAPAVEAVLLCCYSSADRYVIDALDFAARHIDRWSVARVAVPAAEREIAARLAAAELPAWAPSHREYCESFCMKPHAAQLSRRGMLLVSFGNGGNGFYVLAIDTRTRRARVLRDDHQHNLCMYSSTGGFSPDHTAWHFARWPLGDTLDILKGRRADARCEIGRLDLCAADVTWPYRMTSTDHLHQVICADGGRFLALVPFDCAPKIAYPPGDAHDDPQRYQECHEVGLAAGTVVTVDLASQQHWETTVNTPVLAHLEADPREPDVLYASAHNFGMHARGAVLEGPAAIYKLRVGADGTQVVGKYIAPQFFRATQHWPFQHQGRTLLAATNMPNKFDLIDARTMTLWRRRELFPAPEVNLQPTGNRLCPLYPDMCCSISPSRDGRYLVLELGTRFQIYDLQEDRTAGSVARCVPEGCKASGHVRLAGF
jgi:hypothetical protein